MSAKRQATTQLNHENWDQDDPDDHEEMGIFKAAPKEILEKRVMRTAKRRSMVSNDETKKSVFSGFGGFNKAQPSSFDFLAKLTNGNKNTSSSTTTNDTFVSSSLFTSKPPSSPGAAVQTSSPGGVFKMPTSTAPTKTSFGIPTPQTQTLFGTPNNTSEGTSIFTASNLDSTVSDSTFKSKPVSSFGDTNNTEITKMTTVNSTVSTAQVSSTIFGNPSTSASPSKSLFSSNNNGSPFKIQPVSSTSSFGLTTKPAVNNTTVTEKKDDDKQMKYYAKLKGLNESVTEWIKKHVDETPLCILTPIFKDYEKYLKEIQEEYESPDKGKTEKMENTDKPSVNDSEIPNKFTSTQKDTSSLFKMDNGNTEKPSLTSSQNNSISLGDKSKGFSFGTNSTSTTVNASTGFSFGVTSTQPSTGVTSPNNSFVTNTSTASPNSAAPFSFGIGKPFSFNSNISTKQENVEPTKPENDAQDDEDAPPKVEFTPIAEENSVFDKRCKIFLKKDGNFVDKGVGTLYIKKIDDSDKHQLLVRANTTLGNVLLNLRLASAIPMQRMGKNNVMIVCIPTPDSKPPPTSILIRVKTSEEADELLETLNKYKS